MIFPTAKTSTILQCMHMYTQDTPLMLHTRGGGTYLQLGGGGGGGGGASQGRSLRTLLKAVHRGA